MCEWLNKGYEVVLIVVNILVRYFCFIILIEMIIWVLNKYNVLVYLLVIEVIEGVFIYKDILKRVLL